MLKKSIGVKIKNARRGGKPVKVVQIQKRATAKDFAKAAAGTSKVMVNHADDYADQPWLGGASTGNVNTGTPGYADQPWLGGSATSTPSSKGGKFLDAFGKLISKGSGALAKVAGSGSSNAGGGKTIDVLKGLTSTYISDIVRRYKAGDTLTEFERRVAMAAIELENTGKSIVRQKAGEWVTDHIFEIGLGMLGLVVVVSLIAKRN